MDHGDASGSGSEQGNGSGSGDNKALRHASPQRKKAWRGSGAITEGVVRTAETLVREDRGAANTRGPWAWPGLREEHVIYGWRRRRGGAEQARERKRQASHSRDLCPG